ncbi:MAG: GAF domain-containing protein, partial [Candidatus Rokuibacteriota bacterium]
TALRRTRARKPAATSTTALATRLDAILADLLLETKASRTTLRLDSPKHGFHVDDVAAEALAAGERSLRGQTSIDQRAAATAQWIERHRRLLVQDDLAAGEPRPPEALIRLYGVKAQMLAPIVRHGRLDGWVSVHEGKAARRWTKRDQAAVKRAVAQILGELDEA